MEDYFNTDIIKKKLFVMALFISTISFSQSLKEADSIESIINNYGKPDENYVRLRNTFVAKKLFSTPTDSTWLSYNFETLDVARELDYNEGKVLAYGNIAIVYQYLLSDPYQAIDNNLKSMEIINNNGQLDVYAIPTLHNIGLLYYEQKEYDKALVYFLDALERIALLNNREDVKTNITSKYHSSVLVNLGNSYNELNKLDSAIYFYKNGIVESEKINNYMAVANAKNGLGLALAKSGKISESKQFIEESINMVDKYNLEFIRMPVYINATEVALASHEYEKAEGFASKILALNKSLKNLSIEVSIRETLAKVYYRKKDYKSAFEALSKHIELKDSLTSNDRKLEISRKEIQFQADKKQLLAQEEIKRQKLIKNTSLFGGGLVVLALIVGSLLYKRKRETEFNLKVSDTELKALRAQMNPHFIFNALNSIGNYITNKDGTTAKNYLNKFSGLMRETLENSNKETITLKEDFEMLKTYLDIERKRFSEGFDFKLKIDSELDPENILVPPMMLQPFVENSIWHGISGLNYKGVLEIEVKKEGDKLLYAIDDNGIGRKKSNKNNNGYKKQSLGIKITKDRIEILNKKKKNDGSLKIIDKEIGTRVELRLPIEKEFSDD